MDRGVPPLGAWRVTVETPDFSVPRDGSAAPAADAISAPVRVCRLCSGLRAGVRDRIQDQRSDDKNSAAGNGVHQVAQKERIRLSSHKKATLLTRRHIIKGSSRKLPFAALNEYFCMQVASQLMPTASAQVSKDGMALVVDRFDVDEQGQRHLGMEDFCALLGLRPAAKYDTTWERIAKAVRDHVPGPRQRETFRQLATTLLLTYALRNADCHAKNLALLYTSRKDVRLSPVYDMLTTSVYAGYQNSPPGIAFMGKKTWAPGKTLQRFVAATFGIASKEQVRIIEAIGDAVSVTAIQVRDAMAAHPGFVDIGKRMLIAWHEGVSGLRNPRTYAMGDWRPGEALTGFSEPPKMKNPKKIVVGRSGLLGKR